MKTGAPVHGRDIAGRFNNSAIGKNLPKPFRVAAAEEVGQYSEVIFASVSYEKVARVLHQHGLWKKSKERTADNPYNQQRKDHIHTVSWTPNRDPTMVGTPFTNVLTDRSRT